MSKQTKNSSSNSSPLPLVIVNPKSAAGSTREKWSAIASDLRSHFGPFQAAFTRCPGDGIRIASNAAKEGRRFLIACGGDGTINEVANGIILSGQDAELGIFPSGTGGDFRRTIGMPSSSRDAARALKFGRTQAIDVGKVTFLDDKDQNQVRYFLNESSFGLAADIISRVKTSSALKWVPIDSVRGTASFALSTLQEVVGLETVFVRVKIDGGDEKTVSTVNFSIANARYFGGGMMIAPDAKLSDGFFDIVNIGDIRTAKILLNAYTLYRGTHMKLPEVKSRPARKIEISPADEHRPILLEIDGELPGHLPAVFEVVPKALRLRVPASASFS